MHGVIELSTCHSSVVTHTQVKAMATVARVASRCIILKGKEDILSSSNPTVTETRLFKSFLVTWDRENSRA